MAKQEAKKTTTKPAQNKKGTFKKKRIQRTVPSGLVHVKATFNNTIVTISDPMGNIVAWSSAGKSNFSGSRKSSAYAATVAAQDAAKAAIALGMKECEINLCGPGAGRESAVRGIISSGLAVSIIRDKTRIPHNGCRPRKRRRA